MAREWICPQRRDECAINFARRIPPHSARGGDASALVATIAEKHVVEHPSAWSPSNSLTKHSTFPRYAENRLSPGASSRHSKASLVLIYQLPALIQ